jgi:hypothetical protein
MKNLILLFIGSFLVTQVLTAQNFISENKQWNVMEDFWGNVHTEIFKIEGDTIINSTNYQKVWRTDDSTLVDWWLISFIREEANVVYIIYGGEGEKVMYDFNLETGDTATIANYFCNQMEIVIYNVDTINYLGVDRKRWRLDDFGYEYWIEGIGSTFGPLYSYYYTCTADLSFSLLCFYENDTLRFIKEGEDDCFQSSVGIDETINSESRITISPNPSSNVILIKLPSSYPPSGTTTLTIYNTNAQQVITQQITELQTIVDISPLPTGMYFVRATDGETVMVGKFVKR